MKAQTCTDVRARRSGRELNGDFGDLKAEAQTQNAIPRLEQKADAAGRPRSAFQIILYYRAAAVLVESAQLPGVM
jgi:hypothetical protein